MEYAIIEELVNIVHEKRRSFCYYESMSERLRSYAYPVVIRQHICEEPFSKTLHMHDYPQAWYCHKGTYTHTVGGQAFSCSPGSLVTVPPGTPHSFQIEQGRVELIYLQCSFYFLKRLPPSIYTTVATHLFSHAFGELLKFSPRLFLQLEEAEKERFDTILPSLCRYDYQRNPPLSEMIKGITALYSLDAFALTPQEAATACRVTETKLAPLYEAALYCNKNYLYTIDGNTLAKISNMSRAGFYKDFKKLFGVTFVNYLYALRMYRVKLLLEFSDFSLSYIADKMNFTDITYMGRLFKQHYGLSPLQYRKLGQALRPLRPAYLKTLHFDNSFWEKLNIE